MNNMVIDSLASAPVSGEAASGRPGPTTGKERSFAIDVLRGMALLGILMMNIDDFGTPEASMDIPTGMAIPAFEGSHALLNMAIVVLKWLFFEGKMRGLFSMLFGAGVLLLTSRAERRGAGADMADIYTRRNLWLVAFGILHCTLLWHGDILFMYGIVGLIALYPLRKLRPKILICTGTFISLVFATYASLNFFGIITDWTMNAQVAAITLQQKAGQPASEEQQRVLQAWDERVKSHAFTPESIQAEIAHEKRPYWQSVGDRLYSYISARSAGWNFWGFTDTLSMMMIGMGLLKLGFLTGERPYRTYAWAAAGGFLISAPIYLNGLWKAYQSGFDFLVIDTWLMAPYFVAREAGTLAVTALAVMFIKSGWLGGAQRALANVGKMALTNYLLTTLLCRLIFTWGPWALYGKLEYYQLYYAVFAIWGVNLLLSAWWLRAYQFGPMEWVWRSLTYLKLQPMRKPA